MTGYSNVTFKEIDVGATAVVERALSQTEVEALLLVSGDGGRTWRRQRPPGALLDLAIDPQDPDRIAATGERGLLISRDGGRTWRPASRLAGV